MMNEKTQLKRMADILKMGGTMLPELCPECSSPLFNVQNEVWCINCNKRVIIVKEGEPIPDLIDSTVLSNVEKILFMKLQETSQQIKSESDISKLQELGCLMSTWLEVLDRLQKLKKIVV